MPYYILSDKRIVNSYIRLDSNEVFHLSLLVPVYGLILCFQHLFSVILVNFRFSVIKLQLVSCEFAFHIKVMSKFPIQLCSLLISFKNV